MIFQSFLLTAALALASKSSKTVQEKCAEVPTCLMSQNQYARLQHFTSSGVISRQECPIPEKVLDAYELMQVSRFKSNSSWTGVKLSDMHGVALSPLFIPYSKLSCTEFIITQLDDEQGISLGMKHFLKNSFDFEFYFNATGWIKYKERYGCENNSLQVDNIRILRTDYENYMFIYACLEPARNLPDAPIHTYGYLVLVKSDEEITMDVQLSVENCLTNFIFSDNWNPVEYGTTDKDERTTQCAKEVNMDKKPLCVPEKLRLMKKFEDYEVENFFHNIYPKLKNSSGKMDENSLILVFVFCMLVQHLV